MSLLLKFLRKLFKRERPTVIYPFRPMLRAMYAKDAELFARVGPLSPSVGVAIWREKYPEDFAE